MKTAYRIRWFHTDNYGSVKSAFVDPASGKFFQLACVGQWLKPGFYGIKSGSSYPTTSDAPFTNSIPCYIARGAVYQSKRFGRIVIESCDSRVAKVLELGPMDMVMNTHGAGIVFGPNTFGK